MTAAPQCSIIIPAVKARHLPHAVASALAQQEAPPFEVVVIDDAAGPEVAAALQPFAADERLRVVRLAHNLGAGCPARTWNHGLSLVHGQWVLVLGDDDCLSSNALAELARLAAAYPECALLRLRLRIIDDGGRVQLVLPPQSARESWYEAALARLGSARPLCLSEYAFRRDDLLRIGGFAELPFACGSDEQAVFTLAQGAGLATSNAAWAAWRRHGANLSDAGVRPEQLQAMRTVACWLADESPRWQPRPDPASAEALALVVEQYLARINADLAGLHYLRSWRGRLRGWLRGGLRRLGMSGP